MSNTNTNWSQATLSLEEAIKKLMSSITAGKNAWLEVRKNSECAFPLTSKNEEPNIFKYQFAYGILTKFTNLTHHKFFNKTLKKLSLEYTPLYLTRDNHERYKQGKKLKGEFTNSGICTPVLKKDATEWRNDGYNYEEDDIFTSFWKLKAEKSYNLTLDLDAVYVVVIGEGKNLYWKDKLIDFLKENKHV